MPSLLSTTNRVIAVTIGGGVALAQTISTVVGWQAMPSVFEKVANTVAAPLAGVTAAWLWSLLARSPRTVRRLFLPSPRMVEKTLASAQVAGILPEGYLTGSDRDRLVARTIAFDRKAGLTDEEIRKDLSDLLGLGWNEPSRTRPMDDKKPAGDRPRASL